MAKKEDRKKRKKRKKEDHKSRKRAERDPYPRTEIMFDGEDQEFMVAVENIIQAFDYANEDHCPEEIRGIHRMLRAAGVERLKRLLGSKSFGAYLSDKQLGTREALEFTYHALWTHLPTWIFERLPERYTQHPLPHYFFEVTPARRGFVVSFQFLPKAEIGLQRVWHSLFEPTVNIAGHNYRVGFTRHVFERARDRLCLVQPTCYLWVQGMAEYFRRCVYFEHVLLEDGQNAVRLFAPCAHEIGSIYLQDVAGLRESTAADKFFVVGYCPVELSPSGFAIATTLLFPGYKNTPEAALVNRTRIHPTLRTRLRAAAQDNSLGRVFLEGNIEPLRWYHHNGVPQVVRLDQPLFRHP